MIKSEILIKKYRYCDRFYTELSIEDKEKEISEFCKMLKTEEFKDYRKIDKGRRICDQETAEKFLKTMATEVMYLSCYRQSVDTLVENAKTHKDEMLQAGGFFFSSFQALYDAIILSHTRLLDKNSKVGNIDFLLWYLEFHIYKNIKKGNCCIMEKRKIEELRKRYNNLMPYYNELKNVRDKTIAHNDCEKEFAKLTEKKHDNRSDELYFLYVDILKFCILFFENFDVDICFKLFANEEILRECCTATSEEKILPAPIKIDRMLSFAKIGHETEDKRMKRELNEIVMTARENIKNNKKDL